MNADSAAEWTSIKPQTFERPKGFECNGWGPEAF